MLPRSLKKNYPFGNNHRKKFSSSIGKYAGRDDYRIHLTTVCIEEMNPDTITDGIYSLVKLSVVLVLCRQTPILL